MTSKLIKKMMLWKMISELLTLPKQLLLLLPPKIKSMLPRLSRLSVILPPDQVWRKEQFFREIKVAIEQVIMDRRMNGQADK